MKAKKKIKEELKGLIILFFIILSFISGALIGKEIQNQEIKYKFQNNTFIQTIENINENCGSVFFTKRYNDGGWYIFKVKKHYNGWEKQEYIPYTECIK